MNRRWHYFTITSRLAFESRLPRESVFHEVNIVVEDALKGFGIGDITTTLDRQVTDERPGTHFLRMSAMVCCSTVANSEPLMALLFTRLAVAFRGYGLTEMSVASDLIEPDHGNNPHAGEDLFLAIR